MKPKFAFTKRDVVVFLLCAGFVLLNVAAIGSSGREAAKKAICLANVRGTMLAIRSHCNNNDGYFPQGDRNNYVYMSLLDMPVLLMRDGFDLRKTHCPGDISKPGAVGAWFTYWGGAPPASSDWLGGDGPPAGVDENPDFSYYWPSKMFNTVGSNGMPMWPFAYTHWRLSDVRYPARLIAYCDFIYPINSSIYPWPHSYTGEKGILGGFVDGHSAFHYTSELDIERQQRLDGYDGSIPGSYGEDYYGVGSTVDGIKGYDVLE